MTDSGFCSYTNPSRATIPLIRPHQCDSEGGRIRGVLLYLYSIFLKTNELKYTPVYIFIKFIFGLLSFFKICSTNLNQYKTIRGPMKQQMWGTLFILILFINSQQTYSTKTSYFLPMIVTTDFSAMLKTQWQEIILASVGAWGQGVVE